jgi:hypothetical protein
MRLLVAAVLLVTVAGAAAGSNLDAPITLSLIAVAVGAVLVGWWVTRAHSPRLTPRQRVYAIAFWAGAAAVTLAACGELNV